MAVSEEEIDGVIKRTVNNWFYSMPVLYKTVCKNPIRKNTGMSCGVRSGKSRIEYNPELLADKTPAEIKKAITLELSRILLGHCTFRRPEPFDSEIALKASNMAILQEDLEELPEGQSYEYYYNALRGQPEEAEPGDGEPDGAVLGEGDSDGIPVDEKVSEAADATALWNDGDAFEELEKEQEVKEILKDENALQQLSSLFPGTSAGALEKNLAVRESKVHDRIKVAKLFMTEAQGLDKRIGTRNKPNRRFGFMQLGTKYVKDKLHLLCVLDVSGSVSDAWIERYVNYLNFIRRRYRPDIDIVEADTEIKESSFIRMKSHISELHVVGRGGTDFQCVIDFLSDDKRKDDYDGAIVFTDGCVSKPDIPKGFKTRILWAVNEKNEYFEKRFQDEKYVAYLED